MEIKELLKKNISTILVGIITILAFCIRIIPRNSVITPEGLVRFVSNDSWYHMRVVYTLIENFPHQLFYNPWTNYPYGSYVHFGPLFSYLIAIPALILGGGHPSDMLVAQIGAYLPAVLGALIPIPVYYIGKTLRGRTTGILAALLVAIAPGQILYKSLIGFTDNHAAESLFSTIFVALFFLAIVSARDNGLNYNALLKGDIKSTKKPIILAILAGVAYAAYQLVWAGSALFAFMIMIYVCVQFIINNMRKESSDYLSIVGIITFITSSILIYPAINPGTGFSMYHYSWFILVVTLGAVAGCIFLSILEKILISYNSQTYYPLTLVGCALAGIFGLKLISSSIYSIVMSAPGVIFSVPTGGPSTIAEGMSMFYAGGAIQGAFTLLMACRSFTTAMFLISILGIIIVLATVIFKPRLEETYILVWAAMMLLAIYGQNRFAYYYSVNVAILGAYIGCILIEYAKFDKLFDENKIFKGIRHITVDQIVVFFMILMFMVVPEVYGAKGQLGGTIDPIDEWYDSCVWLRDNTPDPGLDFNATFEPPENGELFAYPETAYGVMSWWDYGHHIEVIGHRMPNANPFQAGIGGRRGNMSEVNTPGAASFFTADSEANATDILDRIDPRPGKYGAKYIISDANMATDIFMAMPTWTLDANGYMKQYFTGSNYQVLPDARYYNSMEARLHIFDGNGLQQYRLVHESPALPSNEMAYKDVYNQAFGGNLRIEYTGYVKIFEFVKGAHIVGNTTPNTTIYVQNVLLTNQKREVIYKQYAQTDNEGKFEFVVPYATVGLGPIVGETQYDVIPVTNYDIFDTTDKILGYVEVSEENVLNGDTVSPHTMYLY